MLIHFANVFLIILSFNTLTCMGGKNHIKNFKQNLENETNEYTSEKEGKKPFFKNGQIKFYKNLFSSKNYLTRRGDTSKGKKLFVIREKNEEMHNNGEAEKNRESGQNGGRKNKNLSTGLKHPIFLQYHVRIINIKNILRSSLQVKLDQFCHPGVARCRDGAKSCRCYRIYLNQVSNFCLDNCGLFTECYGNAIGQPYKSVPYSFVQNKIVLTCVVSAVQRKLNNLCGENNVFRYSKNKSYCIPYDFLDMEKVGTFCVSKSNILVICAGFLKDSFVNLSDFELIDNIAIYSILGNMCNETIYGNGEYYVGCQNTSISGKTCLAWETLNINESLGLYYKHNFCRNPEKLDYIYCFVNVNGFIFREHCHVKDNNIVLNNIAYSEDTHYSFDLTMKNVSDFRIRFSENNCKNTYLLPNNLDEMIKYNVLNYVYHDIGGDIALTITFKNFTYIDYLGKNLSICACHNDFYDTRSYICTRNDYKTKIGKFNIIKSFSKSKQNIFYVNQIYDISIDLNPKYIKREIYILSGNFSHECSTIHLMKDSYKDDLHTLLYSHESKMIQRVNPPLDPSKNYSTIYGYSQEIFDLRTLVRKNEKYMNGGVKNRMNSTSDTSFQKLSSLKKGNNLICIKYTSKETYFAYLGKIIYNDINDSKIKYILRTNDSVYENIIYLKYLSTLSNVSHFFFSSHSCEHPDSSNINENAFRIFEEYYTNRLINYPLVYTYSYFRLNIRNIFLNSIENTNALHYFSINGISSIKSPINYICEKNIAHRNVRSISLVHLSDMLYVEFDEFAHHFNVNSVPTSIHNKDLPFEWTSYIYNYFYFKGINVSRVKKKIISVWCHEDDNYISLWYVSSRSLTPFFLIKYQTNAPKFAFVDFLEPTRTAAASNALFNVSFSSTFGSTYSSTTHKTSPEMEANFYIFSAKRMTIKKYKTNTFSFLILVKQKYYANLKEVVNVQSLSYKGDIYFFLLFQNNTFTLLNSNLEKINIINNDLGEYINSVPIKSKCIDSNNNVTCFVLYKYHKILWFNILFNMKKVMDNIMRNFSTNNKNTKLTVDSSKPYNTDEKSNNFEELDMNKFQLYKQIHTVKGRAEKEDHNLSLKRYPDIRVAYIEYIYAYNEKDEELLLEFPSDILVISKLGEYVLYVSSKKLNKLFIYSTNSSEKSIEYYKHIRNEYISNYEIDSIFSYHLMNANFINFFITKKGETKKNAIYSFVHEKLSKTDIIYKPKMWFVYNKNIEIKPIIKGDKRQIKYFTIHYIDDSLKDQYIIIYKKTGIVHLKLNRIEDTPIHLRIVMHGLFHNVSTEIKFNTTCEDGHYYKDKKCHPCAIGFYNNLSEIKNNKEYYTKCVSCGRHKTTIIEKSISENNCLCDLGYEYIKNPNNPHEFICSPCSYGEYKDTISNELCKGNGCNEHSSSIILGAKNAAESTCHCDSGYFLNVSNTGLMYCKKCLPDHYCPSKLVNIQMCPIYNKTDRHSRTNYTSIDSCFCQEGYEPINVKRITKKRSREEHYYKLFFKKYPSYSPNKINSKHICMECNQGYYKDTISFDKCKKCPGISTNKKFGSTRKNSCDGCYRGYYKNSKKVCSACLPNHFCVGSFPQKGLSQYTEDAVICPNNSVTLKPYEMNISFTNCLCVQGYVKNVQTSYNLNEHCALTPLNFYKDTISNDGGTPCPANSITINVGQKSINGCICDKGYYYSKKRMDCVECPIGYYCPEKNMKTKFLKPIKCPKNSGNIKKGSYELANCQCNFGYTLNVQIKKASTMINNLVNKKKKNKRIKTTSSIHIPVANKMIRNSYISLYSNNLHSKGENEKEMFKRNISMLLCVKCPSVTYKSVISNEPCHACPTNSRTVMRFTTTDKFFCLCNEGYYLDEQTCKPCSLSKLYCAGEYIYEISPDEYDEMIKIIEKNIYLFSDSYKKIFVNSFVHNYRGKVSNLHKNRDRDTAKRGISTKGRYKRDNANLMSYFSSENYSFLLLGRLSKIAHSGGYFTDHRNLLQVLGKGNLKQNNSSSDGNGNNNSDGNGNNDSDGNGNNDSDGNGNSSSRSNRSTNFRVIFLKNFFYTDHKNYIYAKYQKFVTCPKNTVIPLGVDSAHTFDDCKCAKGNYLESEDLSQGIKICKPCKEGTFKNFVGDEKFCVSCPPKSTSLQGSLYPTHCFCKEGFYYNKDNCLECLEGATCKGGLYKKAMMKIQMDIENVHITAEDHVKPESKKGYYLDENTSIFVDVSEWKFIKCPINGSCLEKNKCHYSMNNYLCVECVKGYTNSFMRTICVKCPSNRVNIMLLLIIYIIFCFIIIIISFLNISSGFYRRSIHSIVIKIAVNYVSSMLVIKVLEENKLQLPTYVYHFYNKINKFIYRVENSKIVSVDCLLRYYFDLSYADSFFYTSLVFFLIPLFLMATLTVILFLILKIYTLVKSKAIANKLDLLRIAKKEKIHFLANSLENSYSKERFIMILRYITLTHYSLMDRVYIFFEDMIPVYVTFLFIMHAKTSLRMFQLFDCSYIKYTKHFGKYVLSRASSVQCDLKTNYLKFFLLGISGTIVWSLGIPLFSFYVLYINRHNLFHENVRIKYGFLHNGYLPNRWYWEIIVFARKISVLFITTVILFSSDKDTNTSRLLIFTFVAIFSLYVHFIFQPFDKRNFFTLNKLENFSLYIWVSTIIVISVLLSIDLNASLNFLILFFLIFFHIIFIVKLLICLFYECIDNIRRKKACYHIPIIGIYAKLLGDIVEKRKKKEPLIYYDKSTKRIAIILPERVKNKKKARKIKSKFTHAFTNLFKSLFNFKKKAKREGYDKLKNSHQEYERHGETKSGADKSENGRMRSGDNNNDGNNDIYNDSNNEGNNDDATNYDIVNIHKESEQTSFHGEIVKNQKMSFYFFLKSTGLPIYGYINKEHRMFAIEIYKELLDIFLKNVTLTYVSDVFFEFIFKISINIGNLIDNLDQKDKIFESLDQEQNFNNIIQWSLERKEKYNENKKWVKGKLISLKHCKYNCSLLKQDIDTFQIPQLFGNDEMEEEKQKKDHKTSVSKDEREKLFSFFSDDLLNKKIALSEFYFILIELKLKYYRNLPSYFYMFKLYKKLEKKYERQQLKKLNAKLKECQRIKDTNETKYNNENIQIHEIKEKKLQLYREFNNLSKMMEQLKYKYINLNNNDLKKGSCNEWTNEDFSDDISLSSSESIKNYLLGKELNHKGDQT
ncbi:cysteine repeat modular protein 1 [Plasmodium brasilianum]|uniref:Cysteine repeat modular protein 1 n=1 Tax=Plasmodium brasilianum TaxID=5824 RepID=A0ACB9YAX8_PLABR|nr:cysteine repeat modular protein 1 [Plasmodium brasilianum]